MFKRNRILAVVLASAIGAGLLAASVRPACCAYHRWRFAIANDYMTKGPSEIDTNGLVRINVTEVAPVHEYHMKRLVDLGAIARIDFKCAHILNRTPEGSALIRKMLHGECPSALYWSSPSPSDTSRLEITVWCEKEDEDSWNRFLRAADDVAAEKPEPSK